MDRFVVISGCSGGGKSTLISELARRGHAVVGEPGRRIIEQEKGSGGGALPWVDMAAFGRRAIELALEDRATAMRVQGWVFFDRGLIDAAAALEHATGEAVAADLSRSHRYNDRAFLAPPWPEIYRTDQDRRHGLDAAIEEYGRLLVLYPALGYQVILLPRAPAADRADFLLERLAA